MIDKEEYQLHNEINETKKLEELLIDPGMLEQAMHISVQQLQGMIYKKR